MFNLMTRQLDIVHEPAIMMSDGGGPKLELHFESAEDDRRASCLRPVCIKLQSQVIRFCSQEIGGSSTGAPFREFF